MIRLFGCRSVPVWYIEGWAKPKPQAYPEAELQQLICTYLSGARTYGDWKGITGPGKRLKDLLAKDKHNDN